MFDVGFSEVLVIFVLALIVLGPEKLPRVAAQVGKWIGRARAMARQFREQLEEEVNVEATRKAQASASPSTPRAEAERAAAGGEPPVTTATSESSPPSDTSAQDPPAEAKDVQGEDGTTSREAHVDLSNEPWPYTAPAPPPEVADVFHDVLVPRRTAVPNPSTADPAPAATQSTEGGTISGAAAPPAAAAPRPSTASPMSWPHDHDIPETITEKASEDAQPTTHERGP